MPENLKSIKVRIVRFRWFLDSIELAPDNSRGVSVTQLDAFTSSLSFPLLQTQHSGNYTCVASNDAASDAKSTQLVVNSKLKHKRFMT